MRRPDEPARASRPARGGAWEGGGGAAGGSPPGAYTEGFTLVSARARLRVTEPPTVPPRVSGFLLASRLVDPLAQPRRSTYRHRSHLALCQRSSRSPKSMMTTGSRPVWSTPMIRIAAHPARDGATAVGELAIWLDP